MSEVIRVSELVELAILVERNGEDFYSSLKKTAQHVKAREVFSYLADEERKHISVFQHLLEPLQKHRPAESYPGEYQGYMKAVADSHVFIKQGAGKELVRRTNTALDAIEMALTFEKDTILFFEAMGRFIPDAERRTLGQLMDEERKHILRLTELRETIGVQE